MKLLTRCLFLFLACLAVAANASLIPKSKTTNANYLFDKSTSGVLEIKVSNFLDILQKSEDKRPRVVLFYSPSCPACQRFVPKYEKFAALVKKELPKQVKTYAVSCESLQDACNKAGIRAYPSLKVTTDNGKSWKTLLKTSISTTKALKKLIEDGDLSDEDMELTKVEDETVDEDADDEKPELKPVASDENGEENKDDEEEEEQDEPLQDGDDEDRPALKHLSPKGEEDAAGDKGPEDEEEGETTDLETPDEEQDEPADDDEEASDLEQSNEEDDEQDVEESDMKADDEGKDDEESNLEASDEEKDEPEEDEEESGLEQFNEEKDEQDDEEEADFQTDEEEDDEESERIAKPWGGNDYDDNDESEEDSPDFPNPPAIRPGAIKRRNAGPLAVNPEARGHIQKRLPTLRKKKGPGFFVRHGGKKNRRFQHLHKQTPREGATDSMNAHKPQTLEFGKRRQKVLNAIEKRKGRKVRQKVERRWREVAESQGQLKMPFKKKLKNLRLAERIPLVQRAVPMGPEEELMLDTSLSFLRGIRLGVYKGVNGPLSFARKRALADWLELLSATLPEEWGLHDVIDDLLSSMNSISKGKTYLEAVLDRHPVPRKKWSRDCRRNGSAFTCGFWKLLHTMSIGLAQHRGGQTLIDSGMRKPSARTFSPWEAGAAVRDYMDNFFLCEPCSKHFVTSYDNCSNRRCDRLANDVTYVTDADWKEFAKYLWEVHNDVSVRVAQEKADKKDRAKLNIVAALYPSIDDCVKCFEEDGSWNDDAVFLFLEADFWPGATEDTKMTRLLEFEEGFDAEGAGLFWFLVVVGVAILYYFMQSKRSLSEAMLMAKSASRNVVGPGRSATQKRTE